MTFPAVVTRNESVVSTAGTSHAVSLPTGIVAGDLLLVLINVGSTAATFNALAGWAELLDEGVANGCAVLYREADGTEGATITLTSSASTRSAHTTYRISAAANANIRPPEISTVATGTSTTPDPGTVTPTGGSKDYLWIAFFGDAGEEADDDTWVTAAPSGYSNLLQKTGGTVGTNLGGIIASAERTNTAASEDPATFTQAASLAWRAFTIAVHPEPVGDTYQRDPRWYRANIFFRPSADPIQTLGDATPPTGVTPITLTDTGAETDAITVTATVALTDAGAASDALSVAAAVPLSDTGAGSDALTVAVAVPLTDAGAAADTFTVTATVPLSDTGTGADSISIDKGTDPNQAWPQFLPRLVRPSGRPFQTLGDTEPTIQVPVTLSDTGSATDSLSVDVGADQNQAGPQIASMFLQPNRASQQLLGDASTAITPSLTDAGTATDALTVSAAGPLSDTAVGADTLSIAATVPLTDTAAGADALTVSVAVPLTDTAAGADTVSASAAVPLTDAGAGADSLTVSATASLTDAGTAADSLTIAADVPLSDAATGADSIIVNTGTDPYQAWPQNFPAFTAPFAEPQAAPFQLLGDRSTGIVFANLTDAGTGDDTVTITATAPLTDAAVGADGLTLTAAVPVTDTGIAADALAATAAVPLTDTATGNDQLAIQIFTLADANQAPLQRFGWGLLRPDGHIPFQLLGDASTIVPPPPTSRGSVTPRDRNGVAVTPRDRSGVAVKARQRQGVTITGG